MPKFFYLLALLLLVVCINRSASAQQLPLFTQYQEYHSFINPGSISQDYLQQEFNWNSSLSYRAQWVGLDGAPRSLFAKSEYILDTKGAFDLSFGGHLLGYNTDPIRFNGAYGKVSALFTDDPYYGAFAVGFSFGMLQYMVDVEELTPFHVNDAILTTGNQQQMTPDIGVGVSYYKQFRESSPLDGDVIYAGLSVPQIIGWNLNFQDEVGDFSIEQVRHIYAVAGYYRYFNESTYLQPSVWIKYAANTPLQIDLLLRYQHFNKFWGGIGFSTSRNFSIEGGTYFNLSNKIQSPIVKLGYSFGLPFTTYASAFGSVHEINLAFLLDTRQ